MHALRAFIERYQHQLSIGSFLVGFAIDTVALKRIDLLISNALLYSYLAIVIIVMATLHFRATHPPTKEWRRRAVEWMPFVAQFAFGGMFSGFLIFYSQSGSVVASWPFVALILALIISNEFLRKYQSRLTFQSILLFFCLFSFSIYTLPIILGRMGDDVFLYSGVVALILMALFLGFLSVIGYHRVKESLQPISIGVLAVYGLIMTLYFSNILPPIPLALKDIGVYHTLARADGEYVAVEETQPWYARLTGVTVHAEAGDALFVYSSVFAPTRFAASIIHEWQYFDNTKGQWVTAATIPFPISGGRDGGYRGYSEKSLLTPGKWRVNVETARGQLIGRETFTVVPGSPINTTQRILD